MCSDNSDFDVPRLVRGIQFNRDEYIMFVNDPESLDFATKSREVENILMTCQHTLVYQNSLTKIYFCLDLGFFVSPGSFFFFNEIISKTVLNEPIARNLILPYTICSKIKHVFVRCLCQKKRIQVILNGILLLTDY